MSGEGETDEEIETRLRLLLERAVAGRRSRAMSTKNRAWEDREDWEYDPYTPDDAMEAYKAAMRYAEALGEILGQEWKVGRYCPCCGFDLVNGEEFKHQDWARGGAWGNEGCAWLIAAKAGGVL